MMAQGVLSFKYEEEKKDSGMTALAGLPVCMKIENYQMISVGCCIMFLGFIP